MSYLVLARKYRPPVFADVIGQPEIVDKLKTALASGRTAHAYLFCGPRGVGKTTCARILAREFNKNITADQPTLDLGETNAFDLIEIDGASNNGVDEIRTLRDNAQLMPMGGGVKVYIIDEVHMLSTGAFNALLKTLEEPPPHVKFILATTDPNKLPLTVVSRCQRFDFRRIPLEQMAGHLKEICVKEGFVADDDALLSIARAAQGSMRDALSVLDQLSSTSSGKINLPEVNAMLGYVEIDQLFALGEALLRKDCASSLNILDGVIGKGKDVKQLLHDMIGFFRNLMVMKAGGAQLQGMIDYSASYKKKLNDMADLCSMREILFIIEKLVQSADTARIIEMPLLALEISLAEITSVQSIAQSTVQSTVQPVVKQALPAKPVNAPAMILNNRGLVSIEPIVFPSTPEPANSITLETILREWNALTHAVCQQSMPAGTYLQEGRPLKLNGRKLTVAFSHHNEFHKEFLDIPANLKILSKAFTDVFKQDMVIEILLTDETGDHPPVAAVNDALAIFGGKVVNEWDNGNGLSKGH
jgi:DNA polymerase-3 subunit gamma/tau